MAQQGYAEDLLRPWFPDGESDTNERLTEADIRGISNALELKSQISWSRIPRIYTVLRKIGQVDVIDAFVDNGISDLCFPFSKSTLPEALRDHGARLRFLKIQHLVYNTEALKVERHALHGHFSDPRDAPFKRIGELGKGGFGYVDHVISTFSNKEFARKLILRGKTFRRDKQVMRDFEKELTSLKRVAHRHLVRLTASYTDKKYVALVMEPVADCNLEIYLQRSGSNGRIRHQGPPFLRSFFGCLAAAISYLHDNCIRHKDIKPSNILIKHDQVFLTDFGTCLDWSELGKSTTATALPTTPRYCAPEVMMFAERNSMSDMWSLGCVYLEMWTVVKQLTIIELKTYLTSHGSGTCDYHSNRAGFMGWLKILEEIPGYPCDSTPLTWIVNLLEQKPAGRWSVHTLEDHIHEASIDPSATQSYMGLCCIDTASDTSDVQSSLITMGGHSADLFPSTRKLDLGKPLQYARSDNRPSFMHQVPVPNGQVPSSIPKPMVGDERSSLAPGGQGSRVPDSTIPLPDSLIDRQKISSSPDIDVNVPIVEFERARADFETRGDTSGLRSAHASDITQKTPEDRELRFICHTCSRPQVHIEYFTKHPSAYPQSYCLGNGKKLLCSMYAGLVAPEQGNRRFAADRHGRTSKRSKDRLLPNIKEPTQHQIWKKEKRKLLRSKPSQRLLNGNHNAITATSQNSDRISNMNYPNSGGKSYRQSTRPTEHFSFQWNQRKEHSEIPTSREDSRRHTQGDTQGIGVRSKSHNHNRGSSRDRTRLRDAFVVGSLALAALHHFRARSIDPTASDGSTLSYFTSDEEIESPMENLGPQHVVNRHAYVQQDTNKFKRKADTESERQSGPALNRQTRHSKHKDTEAWLARTGSERLQGVGDALKGP